MARVILYYYSDVVRCAESRTEELKHVLCLLNSSLHTLLLLLPPFSSTSLLENIGNSSSLNTSQQLRQQYKRLIII